jgi:hypothetical protein
MMIQHAKTKATTNFKYVSATRSLELIYFSYAKCRRLLL